MANQVVDPASAAASAADKTDAAVPDLEDETTEPVDVDALDLDIQGAMYELCEFAGLCGDEAADPDFASLPEPVQLALHTIASFADFNAEAEPGDATPAPSTALATGQAAAAAKLAANALIQKEAGPDAGDVYAPGMVKVAMSGPPAQLRKHMASAHGFPAGKLANLAAPKIAGMHKAAHAKGTADHTHASVSKEQAYEDTQSALKLAIEATYKTEPGTYVSLRSTTGKTVVFTVDGGSMAGSYQADYTIDNGNVHFGSKKAVTLKTVAVDKAEDFVWLEKEEAQQIVYSVVLHPHGPDYHGDEYPPEEIEKAAHKFMQKIQHQRIEKAAHNNGHGGLDADADIIESFIAPMDFDRLDPAGGKHKIWKGSWCIATKVNDAALWTSIIKGERGGVSIEGAAIRY